jgi:isopenicillin-N epimerase
MDRLNPLQVSWGWHYERQNVDARDDCGSTPRIRALEMEGTRDYCPWLTAPAAIDFQANLGWNQIRERIAKLVQYTRQRLSDMCGLELSTPANPALHGSMTAFRIPARIKSEWHELRQQFWNRGIEIPIVIRPDHLLLRVSTHFYNTHEEIDRLARAVEDIFE